MITAGVRGNSCAGCGYSKTLRGNPETVPVSELPDGRSPDGFSGMGGAADPFFPNSPLMAEPTT